MDQITQSLVAALQAHNISPHLITFLISLIPLLELRGGILVAGAILKQNVFLTYIAAVLGNMLPIPFILLFIRKIFDLMRKNKRFGKLVDKLEQKADKHKDKIDKYRLWGLFLLVAIPLPGTGAWTGALVAALMDIRIRHALPVIAAGVIVAGIIVATLSYGVAGFVG